MAFSSEFKEFISKGNVIDLAVGVVIGASFGKIVTSLVDDILMPPIGMAIGGVDFKELKLVLHQAVMEGGKEITPAVSINYGNFLQTLIQFLIIALAIFAFVVKPINHMRSKKAAAIPLTPPPPTDEVVLLTEIRDSLRNR